MTVLAPFVSDGALFVLYIHFLRRDEMLYFNLTFFTLCLISKKFINAFKHQSRRSEKLERFIEMCWPSRSHIKTFLMNGRH